jgi:hypothetical protein
VLDQFVGLGAGQRTVSLQEGAKTRVLDRRMDNFAVGSTKVFTAPLERVRR